MITRLEAYGYRCFPRLTVDVDRYQVLAGANGAGKTTLLDLPVLLGDLLQQRRVGDAFLQRQDSRAAPRARTLAEVIYRGQGTSITFAVEARLPADLVNALAERSTAARAGRVPTHLRYELRLELFNEELEVAEEYLFLFPETGRLPEPGMGVQGAPRGAGRALRSRDWQSVIRRPPGEATTFLPETTTRAARIPALRVPAGQTALAAVPADQQLFPVALWFGSLLREGAVFLEPEWADLRQAAPPGDPPRLLPSARNTPWLVLDLQERDPDRFSFWVDHVRTALPQVSAITAVEREEDHHAYLKVDYSGGYEVTSSGLSEGTLRILTLTLLPYLPTSALPQLLVTEEPENGIHPRAVETVVQSLSTIQATQVWVSTHSPIVLADTALEDVLAARLDEDGAVTVVPGTRHPRLRDWQGSVDLGTLFAAGVLS
ncbi:MAG: AAA family ATPase [Frankia sp.]|nr:AAA family ATPase [Frankia sp.]